MKKIWGTRTLEELKHYIEHGQPHPRKLKAQRKQTNEKAQASQARIS